MMELLVFVLNRPLVPAAAGHWCVPSGTLAVEERMAAPARASNPSAVHPRQSSKRKSGLRFCQSVSCFSAASRARRSEEHTSELQSQSNLVCRLLLEKKKAHSSACG